MVSKANAITKKSRKVRKVKKIAVWRYRSKCITEIRLTKERDLKILDSGG
jgi:hypothetical protein